MTTFAFPDTNVWLHFQRFEDFDWRKFVGDDLTIVAPTKHSFRSRAEFWLTAWCGGASSSISKNPLKIKLYQCRRSTVVDRLKQRIYGVAPGAGQPITVPP